MEEDKTMQTKTVTIPNISCNHCKMRIEKTLNALDGVTSASAEVSTKALTVEWNDSIVNWGDIRASLEKIGYLPEE
jgi:copper chaperone CopZ